MKCLPVFICASAAMPASFARGTDTRRDLNYPAWLMARFNALNPLHARARSAHDEYCGLTLVEVPEEIRLGCMAWATAAYSYLHSAACQ